MIITEIHFLKRKENQCEHPFEGSDQSYNPESSIVIDNYQATFPPLKFVTCNNIHIHKGVEVTFRVFF